MNKQAAHGNIVIDLFGAVPCEKACLFSRVFAMPSPDTLSIPAIRAFALRHLYGLSIDPFARDCNLAAYTNDLNPSTAAQSHMDAEEWLKTLHSSGKVFDAAIFDPPYSPRQISECYRQIGRSVGMAETQNAALYRRVRDCIDRVLKPGGAVISFGWNSSGMGLGRRYRKTEIMLVAHGGAHNDTICVAEVKQ